MFGLLVSVGLVGAAVALRPPRPRHNITAAQVAAVRVGMSRADAVACLGAPPGDYSRGRTVVDFSWTLDGGDAWVGDEAAVKLWFDAEGRVAQRAVGTVFGWREDTLLARIRRLLGL